MSEDLEKILRKSLDEADRYRKRVILGSFILACIVAAGLGWLDHLRGQADVKTMLFFGVVTLLISQVAVAVVTWGVVTDLARKTLKAIELLSRE
jgi:hypothetical protein